MSRSSTMHRVSESASQIQPAITGSTVDAFMQSGEAYAKAWLAWHQEVLRFLGSRLQWDGQVSAAVSKCRTLSELAEVQQDWAISAVRDYVDEAGRLAQLATQLVPSWMPCAASRPETPHQAD